MSITVIWSISLALLLVVAVVVALLLEAVRRTAHQIQAGVSAIWTQGQLVANNTIQIPMLLSRTTRTVAEIGRQVEVIDGATAVIETHAAGCPGCPRCVLGKGG